MPVLPEDQEFNTTSRPASKVYVAPAGTPAAPPASAAARAAVPGSSAAIPTEKQPTPAKAGGLGKYLPWIAGAYVLFLVLGRRK
jgi:hypothetical protein